MHVKNWWNSTKISTWSNDIIPLPIPGFLVHISLQKPVPTFFHFCPKRHFFPNVPLWNVNITDKAYMFTYCRCNSVESIFVSTNVNCYPLKAVSHPLRIYIPWLCKIASLGKGKKVDTWKPHDFAVSYYYYIITK